MGPKAIHLGDGNYLDNMRIDIARSIDIQEEWLKNVTKKSIAESKFTCYRRRKAISVLMRYGLFDAFVNSGVCRYWFDEFVTYWRKCLNGRPIKVPDFFNLRFQYRTKTQLVGQMEWDSATTHLKHYQNPDLISNIFHFVTKYAYMPVREARLPRFIPSGGNVLEYGCGLSPFYRTYRRYYNYLDANWYLADIPWFTFHYCRSVYGEDAPVRKFISIEDSMFDDPLKDVDQVFDLIIIQEVFEHLTNPLHIARYLSSRLRKGGLFYFDFEKSNGQGLDTPAALEQRSETLHFLAAELEIIDGKIDFEGDKTTTCIGRKK